jgi:hypothetical protein
MSSRDIDTTSENVLHDWAREEPEESESAAGDRDDELGVDESEPNAENRAYLEAKRDKLGHRLHHQSMRYDPRLFEGAEA